MGYSCEEPSKPARRVLAAMIAPMMVAPGFNMNSCFINR